MSDEAPDDDVQYETICMFPDYADTALWFDGPVDYSDTGLTDALVTALKHWEQTFYESRTDEFEFVSPEAEARHLAEGRRLAERVSAEVGPHFSITCSAVEGSFCQVELRSESPAKNPAAESAFTRLREERIAEDERAADIFAEADGSWTAYAPLSGQTFIPDSRSERSEDRD